jgi:signal transduction histidine kinase/EAL domain-containing protein (putative c-di-GMP-specific phosphodiesterase class I)/DNA-binding response OmpR family regulator
VRGRSLAAKLAFLVVAALSSAFALTAATTAWFDAEQQARLETDRLTQTARVIASVSAEAVASGDQSDAFRAVRSIAQMPGLSYARLEGEGGAVLAETGAGARLLSDLRVDRDSTPSVWQTLNTGSIQVSVPVVFEGRAVGRLVVFGETPGLRGRVLAAAGPSLLAALAATCVGLLVALRLARSISGPITVLASRVRRIHETQIYAPVDDVRAEGEVRDLIVGVNAMMLGLQSRDAQIADHVRTLEQKVEVRTGELAVAKQAAEAANAAKSDFLAVMSHEIRTPLNGILALGDLLSRGDLPPRERRYADVIASSGRALLHVINDILDFSKVEAGKLDLEILPFDPVELVEGVAELFAAKAAEKHLDLAAYVDPTLGSLSGDAIRIRQVLSNLLNNAIKFTEVGGILIEVRQEGDGVRFEVRDTGPGIPEAVLPTLFDAFTQADQSTTRLHGGTGLGLAICDRLVGAMGGRWAVASTVGTGSAFAFVAPLTAKNAAIGLDLQGVPIGVGRLGPMTREVVSRYIADFNGQAVPAEQAASALVGDDDAQRASDVCLTSRPRPETRQDVLRPLSRKTLMTILAALRMGRLPDLASPDAGGAAIALYPGVRVLVVDDSEVNREVARETLERLEAEVAVAEDGLEAVERVSIEAFDLVLMDGSMPKLDGFEASARIRRMEAETGRPRTLIYALTAHVVGAAADAWRGAGMDGVVHKPFTLSDLAAILEQRLPERRVEALPSAPSSAAIAGDDGLFDAATRVELTSMGDGFVARVQALYRDNAPLRLNELERATAAGDLKAAGRAAHALKSMSLSLGAKAVADLASRIEHDARGAAIAAADILAVRQTLTATVGAMGLIEKGRETPSSAAEALADAIENGRVSLVYQPLFTPRGAFARKVEALTRWRTVEGEWTPPDVFVKALEGEGRIADLTDFVLARALEDARAWPGVQISVNAGASEFQAPDFPDRVQGALEKSGLGSERLEIEVTETAMLAVEEAGSTLAALAGAGVSVALDDFGAGYTSLHALRDLPFRTLKIDKGFVDDCCRDSRSAAIIHAVAGVARALGMKVVCEGVETQAQADFLRVAGAHMLQGYFFSRPVGADAINILAAEAVKDVA